MHFFSLIYTFSCFCVIWFCVHGHLFLLWCVRARIVFLYCFEFILLYLLPFFLLMLCVSLFTGTAVICTIHQPSSRVFARATDLLLLNRSGQTVYFGGIGSQFNTLMGYVFMRYYLISFKSFAIDSCVRY